MKPRQFSQYVQRCKRMKYHGGQEGNINCLSGWDSRKRAGWVLAGSWSLFQLSSSHCSLGLVSKPPGGGRGFFLKKATKLIFSGQDTWWFRFRRSGIGAQKCLLFEILSKFQFKMTAEHKPLPSSSSSSPNPAEIIRWRTKQLTHSSEENRKSCKEVRASNLLLKIRKRTEHTESKKPELGAMTLHLGSRMLRKPWVLTELQRSFQTGVSQSG